MMSDDPLMVGDCGDVVAADPYADVIEQVIALASSIAEEMLEEAGYPKVDWSWKDLRL